MLELNLFMFLFPAIATGIFMIIYTSRKGKEYGLIHKIFAKEDTSDKTMSIYSDESNDILERFVAMGDKFFQANGYGIIENIGIAPLAGQNNIKRNWGGSSYEETKYRVVIMMKHCFVSVEAVNFPGTLEISSSNEYFEILTGRDIKGRFVRMSDNIRAPHHARYLLDKYLRDYYMIPKRWGSDSIGTMPVVNIVIAGKDVRIEDKTINKDASLLDIRGFEKSGSIKHGCYVVPSIENALLMIKKVDEVFAKKGVTFTENEIIAGINSLSDEHNYSNCKINVPM